MTNWRELVITKTMHQPYFVQTQQWAEFWQLANPVNHTYFWIETKNEQHKLKFLVCQYPWHLKQNLWYVSKGGILEDIKTGEINNWNNITKADLQQLFLTLVNELNMKAKKQNITFVKYDFEEEMIQKLELESNQAVLELLQKNIHSNTLISNKIIQFLSTMTLAFDIVQNVKTIEEYTKENLSEFWNETKSFWKTTNSNVKRYTKKSIEKSWVVSTEKSQENFEKFFRIYNHTKDTRGFAIQSRDYLLKLYAQNFSKIIIINDENDEPQCVWYGIQIGDTQTYLYGGNTQKSFDDYGQYLVHLIALNLGLKDGAKFYDLGGYDPNMGYGKFKDNYKGTIRTFSGVFDVPINNWKYKATNAIISVIKKIQSIF